MFASPRVSRFTLPFVVLALATTPFMAAGCAADPFEAVESTESAAKVGGESNDCFPRCKQGDFDALVNVGKGGKEDLDKACETLREGWKKPVKQEPPLMDWPGWDDDKPICIGHKDEIKNRTDCNRLVDAPNWTPCKNQLMLVCRKNKKKGFGQIILVPPKGGFPKPLDPPSITDQELACIKQWKCPVKNPSVLPKNVTPAAAAPICDGPTCSTCEEPWVIEAPTPETEPVLTTTDQATPDAFGSP